MDEADSGVRELTSELLRVRKSGGNVFKEGRWDGRQFPGGGYDKE